MPQNGFLGADHSPTTPLLPKGDLPAVAVPRIARESISQPGTPTERDRVLNEHRQLHPQSSFQYSISRRLSILETDDDLEAAREQRILDHDLSGKLTDEELFGLGSSQAWKGKGTGWKNAQHVAAETFAVLRMAGDLWSYLGLGWRWFYKLIQLVIYAGLLMPGFIQMVVFYFGSARVIRSIPYGKQPRNRLDMYVPKHHWRQDNGLRPVVIYVTGGAWTIGYKAWGALLGRRLSKQGVIVCCLDYRNFPQGTVMDMLQDINTGVSWVLQKIVHYGGNPDAVYLVGQSCGAQLTTLSILTQAEQEARHAKLPGGDPRWSPKGIKGLVGVSGVYNCHDLADHLHGRGLYRSLFNRIMSKDGRPELKLLSPTYCVMGSTYGEQLPPMLLLHGNQDVCAPVSNATQFAEALEGAGAEVKLKLYDGQTHTSPLIENPMRGGQDQLMDDILSFVQNRPVSTRQIPLCPGFLISAAAMICPF
ncbi:hypothetical protein WJX74_008566 [Apatococcus lobatus]|uniref:protein-S-isoprenylcysteine alpha-carbonyl methylesterase n=1 Tax=Apatococcus lobatus TaxID=904363 RepID=A0AAW1QB22_9CHLO